ncbi:MAG: class I SAM-dependent methyltransferase [Eubacteriales bacterium]|nr:class I SAM-dependent methyltransferase [Eubacteriales bacterium]
MEKNYYGSLCTEMYELLHPEAPRDELEFYLSYARPGMKILEPLCGSGRFFVPFLERGLDITGVDSSREMLDKLMQKAPAARVVCTDLAGYETDERFDYIFISSGSVSLFTDMDRCREILAKMKGLLAPGGRFVFAVETLADICPEDRDYKVTASVKTREGWDLVLKTRDHYDPGTQTQFSPSLYELYDGETLVRTEQMDFQTHLYALAEIKALLKELGFAGVEVYSGFDKTPAQNSESESLLIACG